jgi:hypothetical protein
LVQIVSSVFRNAVFYALLQRSPYTVSPHSETFVGDVAHFCETVTPFDLVPFFAPVVLDDKASVIQADLFKALVETGVLRFGIFARHLSFEIPGELDRSRFSGVFEEDLLANPVEEEGGIAIEGGDQAPCLSTDAIHRLIGYFLGRLMTVRVKYPDQASTDRLVSLPGDIAVAIQP